MMKKFLTLLLVLSWVVLASIAYGGEIGIPLSWDVPTTNSDGTSLTDLAGYTIYYGTASGDYSQSINVGNVTTYTVPISIGGTYYFAVTAYDTTGNESDYSNEVTKVIEMDLLDIPGDIKDLIISGSVYVTITKADGTVVTILVP